MMRRFEKLSSENVPLFFDILGNVLGFSRTARGTTVVESFNDIEEVELEIDSDEFDKKLIIADAGIQINNQFYNITDINEDTEDFTVWSIRAEPRYLELGRESMATYISDMKTVDQILTDWIKNTGWTFNLNGIVDTRKWGLQYKNETRLSMLIDLSELVGFEYRFDTINRIVNIYLKIGSEKPVKVSYGTNIRARNVEHLAVVGTHFVPIGKGGLSIAPINGGKNYLEDYTYYTKMGIPLEEARKRFKKVYELNFEGAYNSFTLLTWAKEDMVKYSRPHFNFQCDIVDLWNSSEGGYDDIVLELGDVITLEKEGELTLQRIVKIVKHLDEEMSDELTLNELSGSFTRTLMNLTGRSNSNQSDILGLLNMSSTVDMVNLLPVSNELGEMTKIFTMPFTLYKTSNMMAFLELKFQLNAPNAMVYAQLKVDDAWLMNEQPAGEFINFGKGHISIPVSMMQIPEGEHELSVYVKYGFNPTLNTDYSVTFNNATVPNARMKILKGDCALTIQSYGLLTTSDEALPEAFGEDFTDFEKLNVYDLTKVQTLVTDGNELIFIEPTIIDKNDLVEFNLLMNLYEPLSVINLADEVIIVFGG
jgi:phage minor structural protein